MFAFFVVLHDSGRLLSGGGGAGIPALPTRVIVTKVVAEMQAARCSMMFRSVPDSRRYSPSIAFESMAASLRSAEEKTVACIGLMADREKRDVPEKIPLLRADQGDGALSGGLTRHDDLALPDPEKPVFGLTFLDGDLLAGIESMKLRSPACAWARDGRYAAQAIVQAADQGFEVSGERLANSPASSWESSMPSWVLPEAVTVVLRMLSPP